MEQLFDGQNLSDVARAASAWLRDEILVRDKLFQALVALLLLLPAWLGRARLSAWLGRVAAWSRLEPRLGLALSAVARSALVLLWAMFVWLAVLVYAELFLAHRLLNAVAILLTAWIAIRFLSSLLRDPGASRAVAIAAWLIAALGVLELLEPTMSMLDRVAIDLGELHLSLLKILKAVLSLAALLWLARVAGHFLDRRIHGVRAMTPSMQVLASKITKIVLVAIAIMASLSIVGVDLTAFAVFSGAVGVGIGFGLQKVVSNLISGMILLLDRSIKPGDVISVDDTYGWIKDLNARYVSVVTRDGMEHLIPNEDLITQKVTNWSFSDSKVRMRVPVGVSYASDPRQIIALCVEAATAVERIVDDPKPVCLFRGFGDSSLDFEIRFWIQDAQNGVSNVKSQVLLEVWDRFKAHDIEIPFPQRDLHLRSAAPGVLHDAESVPAES